MDKVKEYKKIVGHIFAEVAAIHERAEGWPKTQRIIDEPNGQFLLYQNDWKGERRNYGCFLHLEVNPSGKVWVHHDGTDLIIAEKLMEAGIPKEDIVLGFRAPIVREDMGFAVT
jgi:hypothetical protein